MFRETRLYMIRHGHLVNSSSYVFNGKTDIPLSLEGEKETLIWKDLMVKVDNGISLVVSSDLLRTFSPAAKYGKILNCPVEKHLALREIDAGRWEGKTLNDILATDAEHFNKRMKYPAKTPFPGGESLYDLKRRVIKCVDNIIKKNKGKRILLIGHSGVIRVIMLHYLNLPLTHFFKLEVDFASLSILRFFDDGNITLKLFNAKYDKKTFI